MANGLIRNRKKIILMDQKIHFINQGVFLHFDTFFTTSTYELELACYGNLG